MKYADYLATVENLVNAVTDARESSAAAARRETDDLQELAEEHRRESQRIQSRLATAASHYRNAAKALHDQPTARLNIRLPERVHPTNDESSRSSSQAEVGQNRAAQALARAVDDYKRAFVDHQSAAASAADALAARRTALSTKPHTPPWWRTPRAGAIAAAVLALISVLAIVVIVT